MVVAVVEEATPTEAEVEHFQQREARRQSQARTTCNHGRRDKDRVVPPKDVLRSAPPRNINVSGSWVDLDIRQMIQDAYDIVPREVPGDTIRGGVNSRRVGLTDRQLEAISRYLWGPFLNDAKALWKLDDFHAMNTAMLNNERYFEVFSSPWQAIARLMRPGVTSNGKPNPVSPENARTYVTEGAKRLGTHPESLRLFAYKGLMAWHIRITQLKNHGAYRPRQNVLPADQTYDSVARIAGLASDFKPVRREEVG
jgi:hypothetical protein